MPSLDRYDTSPDLWHVLHRIVSDSVKEACTHRYEFERADKLGRLSRAQGKLSNTLHPSALRSILCVAACFNKCDVLPPLHVIVLKHLLHFAMPESLAVKYSHTYDRLALGILNALKAS